MAHVPRLVSRSIIVLSCLTTLTACGPSTAPSSGPMAPTAPSPTSPTPTPPGSGGVAGTWAGTGSDSFSPELVRLVISQDGTDLTGLAELKAVNPADGSCGSCHKVKTGTLAGRVSGTDVSLTMTFPAGGDVPTPICATAFTVSGSVAADRLIATYTGTDSCEGVYSNGQLALVKQ